MAKNLKLQQSEITTILQELEKKLKNSFLSGGRLDISERAKEDNRSADLVFTANAFAKMHSLVDKFTTEVGWHGLIKKIDAETYLVYDIMVYPHEVGGATITADYEDYSKWLDTLDDENFAALRFHGHSHVNMSVTPSSVDMDFREKTVSQMIHKPGDNVFYAFLIINKRGEVSAEVYDISSNALFSTADKSLTIHLMFDDETYSTDFIEEAKKIAVEPKPKYTVCSGYGSIGYGDYGGYTGYRIPQQPKNKKNEVRNIEKDDDYMPWSEDYGRGYGSYSIKDDYI